MINNILDEIDVTCEQSERAVMEALFQSYDKALMILEFTESDDISCFTIFQESKTDKANDEKKEDSAKEKTPEENKAAAKKGILKSIFGLIPKLVQTIKTSIAKKFESKRMKEFEKKAKKLGVDINKLSDSEKELLAGAINSQLTEKDINKIMTKRKLKSMGLKAGVGALVIGGSAYYLNSKKELVIEKVNDYKGKIYKTLDDKVLKGVREATDAAVEKISEVADAAAEKIKNAADACKQAIETVVKFLKKLFEAFKKFFNIHLLKYDETSVEKVLCKIDINTGKLYVTFDIEAVKMWVAETKTFVSNAAQFIGRKVSGGNIEKKGEGSERGGAINAVQKDYDNARVTIGKKSGATFVADYRKNLEKVQNKFNAKSEYVPGEFTSKAAELISGINTICDGVTKLHEQYSAWINKPDRDQSTGYFEAEKEVVTTLRGILDTQIIITDSVDAINKYINAVAEMTGALDLGDSSPAPAATDTSVAKKEDESDDKPAKPDTKS